VEKKHRKNNHHSAVQLLVWSLEVDIRTGVEVMREDLGIFGNHTLQQIQNLQKTNGNQNRTIIKQ
jgi:hypothetical protein